MKLIAKKLSWVVILSLSIITLSACGGSNEPPTEGNSGPSRDYGKEGSHLLAEPIIESVHGNSVLILPKSASAAKPVPVVFLAPGFRSKDYTHYQTLLNFIASQGYAAIYANDIDGFSANSIITHLDEMVSNPAITPLLDTSKIGVIGHSSGGGHLFRILKEFSNASDKNWGENGRFLFAIEPWFAFGMSKDDMKSLPSNTNIIIQQYGIGGNNKQSNTDARIPLTEYYLLDSINNKQKDYQIFANADHGYPTGKTKKYSEMQGILKPLDALMELTFKDKPAKNAQHEALELGSDDPYANGHGIQIVKLISDYKYPCNGTNTIINYCEVFPGALPPESSLTAIKTNDKKPKPQLGASLLDQEFGKTVTRMTDRVNQADTPTVYNGKRIPRGNDHPYPKTQAWNSDMSMLRLRYKLYDANTLKELPITQGTNSLAS